MWQACVRLALGQEGLITLDQALSAGCSSDCFKGHVAKGDIERILPGVYRLAGTAESPRQKLRAATLWGGEGTAASHTSAAALVGLKGFTLSDLHTVTTKDPRRAPDWLNVHRLPAGRPGTRPLRGIPTTPPWITLVDLGSVAPAAEVRSALDQALFLGIVSLPQMRWALATFGRDRHRGTAVLRSLLAERDPGYAPPESEGEALFYALIEGSDLPPGVRQFPIWDGKRWRRLDYAWPDPGVGAEFDGWTAHGTREAFQDDRAPRRPSRRRIIKDIGAYRSGCGGFSTTPLGTSGAARTRSSQRSARQFRSKSVLTRLSALLEGNFATRWAHRPAVTAPADRTR